MIDLFHVKAVYDYFAIIKNNQRDNIAMKMIMPFLVPAMFLLDIPRFIGNSMCGEITFRLGTEASAVGNKDDDPFA